MRIIRVGPSALLVEVADALEALALARWARTEGLRADEVVPAARTVLFDGVTEPGLLTDRLADWSGQPHEPPTRQVTVPVRYDGADLEQVARVGDDPDRGGRDARVGDLRQRLLRLRARIRLPHRSAGRARGAPAGDAADPRSPSARWRWPTPGAGSTLGLTRRLAAAGHHGRRALGRRARPAGAAGAGNPGAVRVAGRPWGRAP
ncbi:MAG: carboxyltransferase domain-containing protein [Nocardioides sp.]